MKRHNLKRQHHRCSKSADLSKLNSKKTGIGENLALVVVDLAKGFIDPDSPLAFPCEELIKQNNILIDEFRKKSIPVIFTTTIYKDLFVASVFREKLPDLNILNPESGWSDFTNQIGPNDNELVIEKTHASAFFGTDLLMQLNDLQIDTVIITGVTTSGCVRATAVDSLQNNFFTVIVEDCVGDRNPESHAVNLSDISTKYADVISSKNLINIIKN